MGSIRIKISFEEKCGGGWISIQPGIAGVNNAKRREVPPPSPTNVAIVLNIIYIYAFERRFFPLK